MPCQELFDQQSKDYKNNILNETTLVVSLRPLKQVIGKIYW